jgi:argininosuccinate lyase
MMVKAEMSERKDDRLWGGRFERGPNEGFDAFQRSFAFDRRLLPYELAVDRAWARALQGAGIFDADEVRQTIEALDRIEKRTQQDAAWVDGSDAEDVHHFVEKALVAELGPLGWKLHTGRSRNELVATDFRLFVREAVTESKGAVRDLIRAVVKLANANMHLPMAGMTHMQHAQPILVAHFLLAHGEALLRDVTRLEHAAESADACPMGSGALAGCSFAIDRQVIARELGFSRVTANSLDAVSDRDFALDYLFALTGIATHLSRLSEDFVLFASQEFGYVVLPDEYSTGSSLMPQKKNPDAWELLRGKTGRVTGALLSLLMTLKGLPSSYQRDLQEDKESLFAAHDQVIAMLTVATGALGATRFNEQKLMAAAGNEALLATEAADYLVRRGMPFRKAHEVVGKLLREAERQQVSWTKLPLAELKKLAPEFAADFGDGLNVEAALAAKNVSGGTARDRVRTACEELETKLNDLGDRK